MSEIKQRIVIDKNDPVYNKQVVEMLTVANEFCLFTEKAIDYTKADIITYYRRIVPLLYLKGSLVKDINPENDDINERFVLEEDWQAVLNTIKNKLYPHDHFWLCANPHDEDTEAEKVSIGECIADCYQDMKDFLILYQKNSHSAKENAVHELYQNYITHWGPALTQVLYAFHLLFLEDPGTA